MSELIAVATWIAVLAGVVGITLSVVAIWFSFRVEAASRRVSEAMIRSLQKIESSVERSSADTQDLIKVGWNRIFNGSGISPAVELDEARQSMDDSNIKLIAAGLAEELRSELAPANGASSGSLNEDRVVQRVTDAIQAQLRVNRPLVAQNSANRVEKWAKILAQLSPLSYALVKYLGDFGHLSRQQYERLLSGSEDIRDALNELRKAGLLVPLSGQKEGESPATPVYWFPPGEKTNLRIAYDLVSRDSRRWQKELVAPLRKAGYINDNSVPGKYGWNYRGGVPFKALPNSDKNVASDDEENASS
jgi:hypothetical protein